MLRKSSDVSTENIRTYSRILWAQDTSEDACRQRWQPPWGHEGRCSLELERAWILGDTTELSSQFWDQQKVSVLSLNTARFSATCHLHPNWYTVKVAAWHPQTSSKALSAAGSGRERAWAGHGRALGPRQEPGFAFPPRTEGDFCP